MDMKLLWLQENIASVLAQPIKTKMALININLKLQFCFKASFSLFLVLLGVHLSYERDPLTPNIVTKLQMLAESRCVVMFCEDTVNSFWRTKVLFSSSDTATAAPILGTEYYSRNYLTCRFPNFNSDVTEFCWNSSFMNGFVQFSTLFRGIVKFTSHGHSSVKCFVTV